MSLMTGGAMALWVLVGLLVHGWPYFRDRSSLRLFRWVRAVYWSASFAVLFLLPIQWDWKILMSVFFIAQLIAAPAANPVILGRMDIREKGQ